MALSRIALATEEVDDPLAQAEDGVEDHQQQREGSHEDRAHQHERPRHHDGEDEAPHALGGLPMSLVSGRCTQAAP